jgi:hypothetical protein
VVEIFSIHEPSLLLPCLKGKRAWLFPSLIAVSWSLGGRACLGQGFAVIDELFRGVEGEGGIGGFQGVGVAGLGDEEADEFDVGFVGACRVCRRAL